LRVIFDRSAFYGDRFQALVDSPLRKLVTDGRLRVFHTPIFIEETVTTYGSAGASGDWRQHLAFALEICNGSIFQEKADIWHGELVQGRGSHARYLLRDRQSRYGSRSQLIRRLQMIAASGDIGQE
jgi:hypothetical protein